MTPSDSWNFRVHSLLPSNHRVEPVEQAAWVAQISGIVQD